MQDTAEPIKNYEEVRFMVFQMPEEGDKPVPIGFLRRKVVNRIIKTTHISFSKIIDVRVGAVNFNGSWWVLRLAPFTGEGNRWSVVIPASERWPKDLQHILKDDSE